jgi:hypothetical protein
MKYFSNSDEQEQQHCELFELLARQDFEETQALSLRKIANISGIGSTMIGVLSNFSTGDFASHA